ncbi:MAG: hypothetical protein AAFZ01_04835 [Pseudomonadota bacterium]
MPTETAVAEPVMTNATVPTKATMVEPAMANAVVPTKAMAERHRCRLRLLRVALEGGGERWRERRGLCRGCGSQTDRSQHPSGDARRERSHGNISLLLKMETSFPT